MIHNLTPAAIAQYVTAGVSLLGGLGATYLIFSKLFKRLDALFGAPKAIEEIQKNVKTMADSLHTIATTQETLTHWGDEHLRREHGQH